MRFLFPGQLSITEAEKRAKLATELINAHAIRGPEGQKARQTACDAIPLIGPFGDDSNQGVLHYDLELPAVQGSKTLVLDHMTVQASCESYGKGALAAFAKIKKVKQTKYRFLQQTIERLSVDGHTGFKPKFLLPCITTDGLMDADLAEVIKFIGNQYATMLTKQGPRLDGLLPVNLKQTFKAKLKNSILFAVLRGVAADISSQGKSE